MPNKIQLKRSISTGATPSPEELVNTGEPLVNIADEKVFVSKGDGTSFELANTDLVATKQANLANGIVTTPSYTDNGNGTVTIGTGVYNLSPNADGSGIIGQYSLAGDTFSLTDNAQNYIVADYNGGSPLVKLISDVSLITETTVVPVYSIYRSGNVLHTQPWNHLGIGLANKVHQSIVKTQRYRRESGLSLSETGTRNLICSAGKIWVGAVPVDLLQVATASDNAFLYYHSGGNWTSSVVTQYNNTQYDDGTNLQNLGVGRYAVNWIFRGVESQKHLYIVLGTGNFTLAQAQASTVPAIPTAISSHAVLIGKIIVKNGNDTATSIQSAFDTAFSYGGVTSHEDLTNINQAASGVTNGHINDQAQTIAGVKTFSASPIVPAPTTDLQASTKKYVDDGLSGKQNSLGFTPENVANKKTTLTDSDTDYPTCKAVNTGLSGKQNSLGFTPEDISNKKTSLADNSDTYYPTQKAVKTAVDAKENTLTKGNLTESTSSVLTITGGTGAVIGSGTSLQVKQANTSQSGFLSSTDWNTFNNKQNSLGFTPENVANKVTSLTDSDTQYPSSKAVKTVTDAKMSNPMTTQGDIIYGGTSGTPTRLAKGSAGQFLKMNAGATSPEWADISGGDDMLKSTYDPANYNSQLEAVSNKVTSISSSSTDTQYPTAKLLYDTVGDIETLLANI